MTRDATASPTTTDRQATPGFRRAVTVGGGGGDSHSGRSARERFYVNARARRRQKQKTIRDSRPVPAVTFASTGSPLPPDTTRLFFSSASRFHLVKTFDCNCIFCLYFSCFLAKRNGREFFFFTSTLLVATKFVFFSVFSPLYSEFQPSRSA